ncbi:MAG: hypothetical protein HOP29_11195 [Phycisphaerales bacterium]|nr:hypothetical protein [Phycisphaerales bacterium]
MKTRRWLATAVPVCFAYSASLLRATPPIQFVDVSAARGILPYSITTGHGGGAAAADYDNDGDVDLFIPNDAGVADQLYRNLGNGQFEEIAAAAGVASMNANRTGLWIDYDGDRDLDLLVGNDVIGHPTVFRLYRQESPTQFTDVTVAAGLMLPMPADAQALQPQHFSGPCAGDFNRDGYVDLFVPFWNSRSRVLLNNGNGAFVEVSGTCGVGLAAMWGHQAVFVDFDEDGWGDFYESIDYGPNRYWRNQTDGTFVDVAPATGMANAMHDMGVSLGDYDNDGDFDIYVTNIDYNVNFHNVLLRNDSSGGTLEFREVSAASGVDHGGWGWGATFFDADADGWLDIAATNGWKAGEEFINDQSKFFQNPGAPPFVFSDESVAVGFNDTFWGAALIAFDYDRDGDLDLVQACRGGPLRLLENQSTLPPGQQQHYLVVQPRTGGLNHFAIGAVVRIQAGGLNQMRLIAAGTSYLGQEPAEAYFGLGAANVVDVVEVTFPDGLVTVLNNVAADQVSGVSPPGVCLDGDGDGYGNPGSPDCPNGPAIDCNDSNILIHAAAPELCDDDTDNNCNGLTDCDEPICESDAACAVSVPAASAWAMGGVVTLIVAGAVGAIRKWRPIAAN